MGDRKSGHWLTRLKQVSGVINKGEIHARFLCAAVCDDDSTPSRIPASLCFGNMFLAAMTHTSLKKHEGELHTNSLSMEQLCTNRARLLNCLPVVLCGGVNSMINVMVKVGEDTSQYLACRTCHVHLPELL